MVAGQPRLLADLDGAAAALASRLAAGPARGAAKRAPATAPALPPADVLAAEQEDQQRPGLAQDHRDAAAALASTQCPVVGGH